MHKLTDEVSTKIERKAVTRQLQDVSAIGQAEYTTIVEQAYGHGKIYSQG